MPDTELSGNGTGPPGEVQSGSLPGNAPDFQFFPGNSVLDAGSQRLGACFFRGKAGSKAFSEGSPAAAIGNFLIGKDAAEEALPVAFDRLRNPRHFDEVNSCSEQHDATVAQRKIFRGFRCASGVKRCAAISDAASVHDLCEAGETGKGWDLNLTAHCTEEAPRTVRFLSGAVMACGGYVLSRRFDAGESAAIEFEFARATCVEMYSVLLAAGLELSAQSHLSMAALCQCTRETLEVTAGDPVRVELTIRKASAAAGGPGGSAVPPCVA